MRHETSHTLLYASAGSTVFIFSYPGGELEGTLSGFASNFGPAGLCTDKLGHVFVTGGLAGQGYDYAGRTYEFAHGGTSPIRTYDDDYEAAGCSIDPTTGNLAVSNPFSDKTNYGSVAIYPDLSSTPIYYINSKPYSFGFCAYDGHGNLFIAPWGSAEYSGFAELPKGTTTFKQLALSNGASPHSLQWYNGELIVSQYPPKSGPVYIYRVKVSNGVATVVGTTTLDEPYGGGTRSQFWIGDRYIVGAGHSLKGLFMWHYPEGGNVAQTVTKDDYWNGLTISL